MALKFTFKAIENILDIVISSKTAISASAGNLKNLFKSESMTDLLHEPGEYAEFIRKLDLFDGDIDKNTPISTLREHIMDISGTIDRHNSIFNGNPTLEKSLITQKTSLSTQFGKIEKVYRGIKQSVFDNSEKILNIFYEMFPDELPPEVQGFVQELNALQIKAQKADMSINDITELREEAADVVSRLDNMVNPPANQNKKLQ
ncbi:MAG: Unknown protein [uncultured Campylobacterales bacterium]|uniref:Uncharacterized protein n=1 Tax=uncultured Campylobacterales bacterium TaxID=352960 RepID=A0A6S6SJB7_9BACT|nr:MAG: Unknown protein [uncultured Campylobacterales bacterium]